MRYRKRRKWKYLTEDEERLEIGKHFPDLIFGPIEIKDGWMILQPRYAWDGPSGPTFDTKDTMVPSLWHDAFYQLMREGVLSTVFKDEIDEIFYDLLIERAKWRKEKFSGKLLYPFRRFRARYWHKAVDLGGPTSSYILEAP